jgi:hypothetical protein
MAMRDNEMKRESIQLFDARKKIILVWVAILLAGLACETGEILTPEEAPQRAILAATQAIATGQVSAQGGINIGEEVEFDSSQFLVPLSSEPGADVAQGHVSRDSTATVLEKSEFEGEIWYLLETNSGNGWVPESLVSQVGGPEFSDGDTVYLTGTGFLINIYELPGSNRFVANQERGVAVIVRGTTYYEGDLWYMVEAPTGTGWVEAENLTAEEP